jgi:hypothetical protein
VAKGDRFLQHCWLVVMIVTGMSLAEARSMPGTAPAGGKEFLVPSGTYIVAGPGPATAKDACTFRKPFALHPDQYVLSGGPRPTDRIHVDDDLEVYRGQRQVFLDDDHLCSTDNRFGPSRSYDGAPILLFLPHGSRFRIKAIDHCPSEAILGDLYLHRSDGARWQLVKARTERSNDRLPHTFFDQTFLLAGGFDRLLVRPANRLSREKLDTLWTDLAVRDTDRGYMALWTLAAAPTEAAPFLRERLREVPSADGGEADRLSRLIGDLDSDTFAVRERATATLRRRIERAEPALRDALRRNPSAEVRRRISQLLEERREEGPSAQELRLRRAVEALEHMGTDEARQVLEALAKGPPASRQTQVARDTLERLAEQQRGNP